MAGSKMSLAKFGALLVIVLCHKLSCPLGTAMAVVVKYPSKSIAVTEGSSLKLVCRVEYDRTCGLVKASWCKSLTDDKCVQLTDPGRHSVVINESRSTEEHHLLNRDVVLHFAHLGVSDTGHLQCRAECESSGAAARGLFIRLNVTAIPKEYPKSPNRSDVERPNRLALTLITLLLILKH